MKRLLFASILLLTASLSWSQCSVSFTASASGNTVALSPTITASGSAYSEWFATGGSPSTQQLSASSTATVTYNIPGTYQVCVVMYDTNWNCIDTFCANITTANFLGATINDTTAICGLCDGFANVSAAGGTTPYSYLWSNSATTQSISNLCPGTYTVTVTDNTGSTVQKTTTIQEVGTFNAFISPSDSTPCPGDVVTLTASTNTTGSFTYNWSNGSTSSTSSITTAGTYTVTVTNGNGCTATASMGISFSLGLNAFASSSNETCLSCCDGSATAGASGGGSLTYLWSNSSTSGTISNLCPGTYTVTVTDGSGCMGTAQVQIAQFFCAEIEGMVPEGPPGRVYLIEENSGVLSLADSADINSNYRYNFYDICPGTYYLKVALLPGHSQYSSNIPTYKDSAALWSNAMPIYILNDTFIGISTMPGTNNGGPGFVGGLISQGANRAEGDPVVGATVLLYDENGVINSFTKSDGNGAYKFENIPLGDHTIHVDILNKTSYPLTFTLDNENQQAVGRNFIANSNSIKPNVIPQGIETNENSRIKIFPNPTTGVLYISSTHPEIEHYVIYDLLGKTLIEEEVTSIQRIEVDLSPLPKGQYMIHVISKSGANTELIVRQ